MIRGKGVVLCVALAGCAVVRPEDVAAVEVASFDPEAARWFPGAAGILSGTDVGGERELRHGDQVLFGVELVKGDEITRNLLRIEVVRGKPANDGGTLTFTGDFGGVGMIPNYVARLLQLDLTLFDADGKQLLTSRCEPTPNFMFEQSFVDGVRGAQGGGGAAEGIASTRLVKIVQLLQSDPVLRRLLAEAAAIPLDIRLLFRREVMLEPHFDRTVPAAVSDTPPPALAALGTRYDLPFDLWLNDSLFVRLSATIVDPRGPTGAVAGIVSLRAQQATDATRQVRMQLLACKRGAQTDWQRSGMLATTGFTDEGVGLAFSPDGHFVAMPGERGVVELRDLTAADPTVAMRLVGAKKEVGDLAFLDNDTLLVGRGDGIEVFDVRGLTAGGELQARTRIATEQNVGAIERADPHTFFVGLAGLGVQRWTFGDDLAKPAIETVRASVPAHLTLDNGAVVEFYRKSPRGFLVAGPDRDRVVVGLGQKDVECRIDGNGAWQLRDLPPLAKVTSRRQRWHADAVAEDVVDVVAKGLPGARSPDGTRMIGTLTIDSSPAGGGKRLVLKHAGKMRVLGKGDARSGGATHGFDPSGRFYAFVDAGYRLLVDCDREP